MGGAVFGFVDGVNELPSGLRGEVESFRRSYQQKTPMIFTTRELNVGLDLGIEKKLEMQPLNERQMQEFTCRYLGREQGQQLLKGLGQRLREFGQTPLLLWMLCGVYQKKREIPANLGGVFRLLQIFTTRIGLIAKRVRNTVGFCSSWLGR
ncbi:MAG: hypothetical protein HC916_13655 [Coleofasciculaceae cyanobacterium SM2_1_6]|nr:hypothetical protein [Coleofasciculaceae cyanobacterium SM2_1_6]